MSKNNEIIQYENYAELKIYNKKDECFISKIDLEDIDIISKHKWYLNSSGYFISKIEDKTITLHKFLIGNKLTEIHNTIDHKDRNKLNNMRNNLRVVSINENSYNRSLYNNNTSNIIGVGFDKYHKKYTAILFKDNKQYKKYFSNVEDAIKCRLEWEVEYYKDFSSQKYLYEKYNIVDKDFVSLDNMKIECDKILENINNEYSNRKYLELSGGYFVVDNKYKGLKDFI